MAPPVPVGLALLYKMAACQALLHDYLTDNKSQFLVLPARHIVKNVVIRRYK
jgi:hypothetical protein